MSQIATVGAGKPVAWFKGGWGVFSGDMINWVLMALIFFVIVILLGFIPFLGLIAIYLLIPVLQGGMLQAAQKASQGRSIDLTDLFSAFKDEKKRNALLILGLIMLGVVFLATVISVPFVGGAMFSAMQEGPGQGAGLMVMPAIGVGGLLFGLLVAILLAMLFLFAPALVTLKGMAPVEAIKTSFAASWKNFLPFVLFLLIYVVLSVIAMIPFGLGMLVLLPVMTAAVYLAYKDILA